VASCSSPAEVSNCEQSVIEASVCRPHHSVETAVVKVLADIPLADDRGDLAGLALLGLGPPYTCLTPRPAWSPTPAIIVDLGIACSTYTATERSPSPLHERGTVCQLK